MICGYTTINIGGVDVKIYAGSNDAASISFRHYINVVDSATIGWKMCKSYEDIVVIQTSSGTFNSPSYKTTQTLIPGEWYGSDASSSGDVSDGYRYYINQTLGNSIVTHDTQNPSYYHIGCCFQFLSDMAEICIRRYYD